MKPNSNVPQFDSSPAVTRPHTMHACASVVSPNAQALSRTRAAYQAKVATIPSISLDITVRTSLVTHLSLTYG